MTNHELAVITAAILINGNQAVAQRFLRPERAVKLRERDKFRTEKAECAEDAYQAALNLIKIRSEDGRHPLLAKEEDAKKPRRSQLASY